MGWVIYLFAIWSLKLNSQSPQQNSLGKAPGKIILFGEHSVVYGKPAIAIPVQDLLVITTIKSSKNEVKVFSDKIGLDATLNSLTIDNAIRKTIQLFAEEFSINISNVEIKINSSIPVASGLGSGAAVTVSILKALNEYYGVEASLNVLNQIAFDVEKIHHGTPSGIDNTTILFEKPIFFQKDQPIEILDFKNTYYFVIANTGIQASTKKVVAGVRERYKNNQNKYLDYFYRMGEICKKAKTAFNTGDVKLIGELMNKNQYYLDNIGVSSYSLSILIKAGLTAGSLGVKLSGAGIGGNVIALATENNVDDVKAAFKKNGATHVFSTILKGK